MVVSASASVENRTVMPRQSIGMIGECGAWSANAGAARDGKQEAASQPLAHPGQQKSGTLLVGHAQMSSIRRRGSDDMVLVLLNSFHDGVPFVLPQMPGGVAWPCLIGTNLEGAPDGAQYASATPARSPAAPCRCSS